MWGDVAGLAIKSSAMRFIAVKTLYQARDENCPLTFIALPCIKYWVKYVYLLRVLKNSKRIES